MKIEIWSDVICPWCGIGQHRLDQAIAGFEHREHVQLVHRSFELDPRSPPGVRPVREMLAKKYGISGVHVQAMFDRVESIAAEDGLSPYVVGDNVVGNTRLAHELLAMASERGLEDAAWKRVYRAYFGERRPIFDIDSLASIGQQIGLDPDEVRAALSEGRYRERVEADAREARELGASGVPFVVVDRRYVVSGAQPVETFRHVLDRAWRDGPKPAVERGAACGPEACEAPRGS
jgi:predicted DsbA family dithiol-disulfide isomerase